jgi:pimeloyl-ACP methyl ester carboxylesterase
MALLLQAQRGHPIRLPPVSVFTDEQLQSIAAPVHVLAGEDSKAFDAEPLVARINEITPRGEARLLPEAGHGLSDSHFDDCVAVIRETIATPVERGQH